MEGRRQGRAWTIRDWYGNEVYLTWERWEHIIEFHPEMRPFFDDIRLTVQRSRRRQDALNPRKWFYVQWGIEGLESWNNCIAVVVVYRPESERFIVTAYQDYVRER